MTSHVRRYRRHYKGSGHVWQGRFKAFPVQSDEHYLTVLRYVERNLLRANMVQRSQDWESVKLNCQHLLPKLPSLPSRRYCYTSQREV